jgi:cysteinyl-tRNA synthetase
MPPGGQCPTGTAEAQSVRRTTVDTLQLYNTRTRRKEPLVPLEPGHVRMYSCGPTVYAPQHIGNLRSQLLPDLLRRLLQVLGYRVTHVVNITDVGHLTDDADAGDDKLERAAARTGQSAADIADHYTKQWARDRAAVGCSDPDVLCKATDHIADQIALASALEANGYTYLIADGLYFDVSRFPRYAEFGRLDLAGQETGERVGDVADKRHPADFALWKLTPTGVRRQQEWDSPWGRGFPGWHVECSAMSSRYLGQQFDVHTGGVDHIKVHHTNEIAQSECAWGVHPWVSVWLHNEFLLFGDEKMAKSVGNVLVLDDLVARGFEPLAFRYFFLQAHYRQIQNFTDEAMTAAATGYRRLVRLAAEVRDAPGDADPARTAPFRDRFYEAITDDLNAPRALAVAWDVARAPELTPADKRDLLLDFDRVLGLDLAAAVPADHVAESDPRIDALVAERQGARAARDFAAADRIRDALAAEGIVIVDTPEGARWRRA